MIEVAQVVEHEADQPDLVFDLFDADFLTGEDRAEIDFQSVEADSPAAGDDGAAVVKGVRLREARLPTS